MKKMLALLPLLLLAAGCEGPIAAHQTDIQTYPQVHLNDHWLQTWTRVQPPQIQYTGAQQMQVSVPIENRTDDTLSLDYQYRFLRNGVEVEQRSGWHAYVLPPHGVGQITFTSMVPTANDFDVQIRRTK